VNRITSISQSNGRSAPGRQIEAEQRNRTCQITATSPLTIAEERELGWRIINDDCSASREVMVQAYRGLVIAIARNYEGRGLARVELVEEGNIGLLCAVEEFDPAKGVRFSTCASWWIKQAMKRALKNGTQMHLLAAEHARLAC
jgi:RNA polymerase primary sigma factor